jgi:uncharacterized membrane protein YraQ (UPF0718 family)
VKLKTEIRTLLLLMGAFLVFYFAPLESTRVTGAIMESLALVQWYAREHMVFGLLPAFFIAGAISAFVSKGAVMRYLGARARRSVAYAVASVSGSILAVCSCTILPLFAGIYSRGAGLGPATAFLYAGPAINVMAIILTARVLGAEIGVARAVGAVVFSVVIGFIMHLIFRRDEVRRADEAMASPEPERGRPIHQTLSVFIAMIALLAFANWGRPAEAAGLSHAIYSAKWLLTGAAAVALGAILVAWYGIRLPWAIAAALPVIALAALVPENPIPAFVAGVAAVTVVSLASGGESRGWVEGSWDFAKEILPLLLAGILLVGLLLGRPEAEGLIPSRWVIRLVGGNSIRSSFVAAIASGLMYFCTLTEVPIVQGLMGSGMGKGPALSFLLAGPAVSLPNILILRSIIGTRKTMFYLALVVVMATVTGAVFGLVGN